MSALLAAIALLGSARAQTECPSTLGDADVRSFVKLSEKAISSDDPITHKRVYSEFVRLVPCLDHLVARDAVARLMLDEAIVRYVSKEVWEPALATARMAQPDLDPIPQYLLDRASPLAPVRPGDLSVPDDAALFVDGVLQARVPVLLGDHVVQVWRSGVLRSRFVADGEPLPVEWLAPKPIEVIEIERTDPGEWQPAGRGAVGLGFGGLVSDQLVQDPGTYLADANLTGGALAIEGHVLQPVADNAGAFFDAKLRVVAPAVRRVFGNPAFEPNPIALPSIYLGPAFVLEHVAFGLGGGLFRTQRVEGGVAKTMTLPQAHAALSTRKGRGAFEIAGGLSPDAAHASTGGGWILTAVAPVSWRLGFDAGLEAVWLREVAPSTVTATGTPYGRRATILQVSLLSRIEMVWGADR